jgi:DNA-binding Lrp family transcriptional regulator
MVQKALRDDLDRELVAILKSNARAKTSDIAKKLGIARTTVHERIQRLEKIGYITGYTVRLAQDPGVNKVEAYVLIEVLQQQNKQINQKLASFPEVKQALAISGEFDLLVAVEAPQLDEIDEIIDEIALIPGVRRTQSSLVLGRKLDRR